MPSDRISLLAVLACLFSPGAFAQAPANPSAQQIINALKPTSPISTTTQGMRPLPEGTAISKPSALVAPRPPATSAPKPPPGAVEVRKPAIAEPGTRKPAAVAKAAAPSVNLNVEFPAGSAALAPQSKAVLDQLGKALTNPALSAYKFSIIGHTDTVGGQAANLALSKARAKTVMDYLELQYHIAPDRLEASGVGESGLLVATPPQTANPKNRRVQIVNLGAMR